MDIGEKVKIELQKDVDDECPFKVPDPPKAKVQKENIAKDDLPRVARIQANNGGTLGKNLTAASNGAAGTVNDFHAAPKAKEQPARDTKRNNGGRVKVKGDDNDYPFGVAAHHLIPGEASLAKSMLYKNYMKKNGKISTASGRKYTLRENIGYNVNGAHNGLWMPGNYAIRAKTSPKKGTSWGKLPASYDQWCFEYMRACVKKTSRQFHDSHPTYSEEVLGVLEKLQRVLLSHHDTCTEDCKNKKKLAPPYVLKDRLYGLSKYLSGKLRKVSRKKWKSPFYTSERFFDDMVKFGMLVDD